MYPGSPLLSAFTLIIFIFLRLSREKSALSPRLCNKRYRGKKK